MKHLSRKEIFEKLKEPYDIAIIGGGITGAGLFLEATRRGLKTAIVEEHDFAWGTSSRSSKLVHGGLRYLQQCNFKLTYHAVKEREWMLNQLPGLVEPLPFLFPIYKNKKPNRFMLKFGLALYDLFALKRYHHFQTLNQIALKVPLLSTQNLTGGYCYTDANTDDARLTWRILESGLKQGGVALNYVKAIYQSHSSEKREHQITIEDQNNAHQQLLNARIIFNATGYFADDWFPPEKKPFHLRKLRGSHLIFPSWRLPVAQAIASPHNEDGRVVFIIPWEGVTIVGTTDLDHTEPKSDEPFCTLDEARYLLAHVHFLFPNSAIELSDLLCSYAGVRPIVSTGHHDPSDESRDHLIHDTDGFITVTGGKLTTWRIIAEEALKKAAVYFPEKQSVTYKPYFENYNTAENFPNLPALFRRKIMGRYGHAIFSELTQAGLQGRVANTDMDWTEIDFILKNEMIVHLDDLLLRRTRLGEILPEGAKQLFPELQPLTEKYLKWNNSQFLVECERYNLIWKLGYQPR